MLTGLYPPGHGARHNGIAAAAAVPTLAESLKAAGFATAAFVSAFPLDRRFGLARGFDVYDDELPRDGNGRPLNERGGADTVTRASAWLAAHRQGRFFLWVHLFEPHAPYGNAGDPGTARERYARDVAIADREAGRLIASLQDAAASTLVIATADHGEAFGEHEEIGHSIFVYDTTLRIPLLLRGPGVPAGAIVKGDASLVDLPSDHRGADRHASDKVGWRLVDDGVWWDADRGAADLRRVIRAALRFRMGGPALGPQRRVEVHLRAEARVVRHQRRPARAGQPCRCGASSRA